MKNKLLCCLIAIMPLHVAAKSELQLDQKVLNFLSEYSEVYQDNDSSTDELVALFKRGLKDVYDLNAKTKSRFTSPALSRLLDAPIIVQKNRVVSVADCDELNIKADTCVIIKGQALIAGPTSWEHIPQIVVLGLLENEDKYLIGHVRSGAVSDDAYFEWPETQ